MLVQQKAVAKVLQVLWGKSMVVRPKVAEVAVAGNCRMWLQEAGMEVVLGR
jgi:hypothetical protein